MNDFAAIGMFHHFLVVVGSAVENLELLHELLKSPEPIGAAK